VALTAVTSFLESPPFATLLTAAGLASPSEFFCFLLAGSCGLLLSFFTFCSCSLFLNAYATLSVRPFTLLPFVASRAFLALSSFENVTNANLEIKADCHYIFIFYFK
jgi:hypothetical protein